MRADGTSVSFSDHREDCTSGANRFLSELKARVDINFLVVLTCPKQKRFYVNARYHVSRSSMLCILGQVVSIDCIDSFSPLMYSRNSNVVDVMNSLKNLNIFSFIVSPFFFGVTWSMGQPRRERNKFMT